MNEKPISRLGVSPGSLAPEVQTGQSSTAGQGESGEVGSLGREALAKGWAWSRLKDIVRSITYGHTASASHEIVGPRFLRITDIQNGKVNWETVPYCECNDVEKYKLKNGDIVIARTGATTGKNFLIGDLDETSVFASYLIRLEMLEELSADYLSKFMQTHDYWQQITTVSKGSAQPGANATILSKLTVPVAPKSEQVRIVSAIESLQTRSSRAKQALSEVGPLLSQLRQSVLRDAFSGRLTERWRSENPDTEPASELLKRIRAERRDRWEAAQLAKYEAKDKQPPKNWQDKYKEPEPADESELPELPNSWCWTNLITIANIQSGVTLGSKKRDGETYVATPYLRVANVQRGYLNLDEVKTVEVTHEKAAVLALQAGDVLFNEGGDRDKLGRGWIWNKEIERCIHQNHVYSARLIATDFIPELVSHYSNEFGKDYFFKNASQSVNLASINKTQLSGLPLPVIPVEEQQVLFERLKELLAACDVVETVLASSKTALTQLDQSILAKAFRGELVPQDPRDEPASQLLDRIRVNRETTSTQKSAKKRPKKPKAPESAGSARSARSLAGTKRMNSK